MFLCPNIFSIIQEIIFQQLFSVISDDQQLKMSGWFGLQSTIT